jgi:hypothetical protein
MTCKLNPAIKKVVSPIVLIFPYGERKQYKNGKETASALDGRFIIESICAEGRTIVVKASS